MIQNKPSKTRSAHLLTRNTSLWIWLSIVAALLAIVGSVVGLTARPIYAGLSAAFLPQALAQDVANLAVASPAMLVVSGSCVHRETNTGRRGRCGIMIGIVGKGPHRGTGRISDRAARYSM